MLQCCFVTAAFLLSELAGTLVELPGQFGGFFGGTAKCHQNPGQFGRFHIMVGRRCRAAQN